MTFKRKLMYTNKSPRRIDRKAGARNKKITNPEPRFLKAFSLIFFYQLSIINYQLSYEMESWMND